MKSMSTWQIAVTKSVPACYRGMVGVVGNLVTPDEVRFLLRQVQVKLARTAVDFHPTHSDKVISDYREATASHWRTATATDAERICSLLQRIQNDVCAAAEVEVRGWLPVHLLEVLPSGHIAPHVDNVQVRR